MKVAVFSDVHANLIALEQFVTATQSIVDGYLCLGDVVNYGPWNDECLEIVTQLPGIKYLEGNHERLFRGVAEIDDELPLVQDFFYCSQTYFSRLDLLAQLPLQYELDTFVCHHTIEGIKVYPDTPIELTHNHIIGHTHHQFRIENSGFVLLNPGSVGQNRGYIDMVDYLIINVPGGEVEMQSVPYDIDLFLSELKRRHYPEHCISYYANKPRRGR